MRLLIKSLAYGGDAVAHASDGRVVFVTGGCPGDTVEAEVTEDRGRYLRASAAAVIEPSSARVQPSCPYFGECGGCQWQHVAYEYQLDAKRQAVGDAIQRIGRLDADVDPVIPSPEVYGYRNKIELLPDDRGQPRAFGFTRAKTAEVLPIQTCDLLPADHRRLPEALSGAVRFVLGRAGVPAYRAAVRVAHDGEIAVDVWTAPGPFPRALAAKAIADATGAKTVTRVIARGRVPARDVRKVEVLSGPGAWHETLGQDRYVVSAPSFFQVNTSAAVILRSVVCDLVAAARPQHVIDAYAGVGTFTLPLARIAKVTAIESSAYALGDLRRNLARARLQAEVTPGDAAYMLSDIEPADVVVVDPPRAGLSDRARDALLKMRAHAIVYVSCDPATLARDARLLVDGGYSLQRMIPIDLFPQTYHVEMVACFVR